MTVTTYGRDVSSREDLDPTREDSETELVAWDMFWRIQTPRATGILADDAPDYGIDLLDMIGNVADTRDVKSLPGRISAEVTKDDRIAPESVAVTVDRTVDSAGVATYAIDIKAKTQSGGSFALVMTAADAVTLLSLSTTEPA